MARQIWIVVSMSLISSVLVRANSCYEEKDFELCILLRFAEEQSVEQAEGDSIRHSRDVEERQDNLLNHIHVNELVNELERAKLTDEIEDQNMRADPVLQEVSADHVNTDTEITSLPIPEDVPEDPEYTTFRLQRSITNEVFWVLDQQYDTETSML